MSFPPAGPASPGLVVGKDLGQLPEALTVDQAGCWFAGGCEGSTADRSCPSFPEHHPGSRLGQWDRGKQPSPVLGEFQCRDCEKGFHKPSHGAIFNVGRDGPEDTGTGVAGWRRRGCLPGISGGLNQPFSSGGCSPQTTVV